MLESHGLVTWFSHMVLTTPDDNTAVPKHQAASLGQRGTEWDCVCKQKPVPLVCSLRENATSSTADTTSCPVLAEANLSQNLDTKTLFPNTMSPSLKAFVVHL